MCIRDSISGVLVQQMAAKGRECLVGISRDPHLGPLIGFGMGGIYVAVSYTHLCYLVTRASLRQPLITIVIAALLAQAAFFAGNLLTATLHTAKELLLSERALWWTVVLPITLWFHASDLIARPSGRISWSQPAGLTRPLTLLAYAAAVILSLLGDVYKRQVLAYGSIVFLLLSIMVCQLRWQTIID